MRFTSREGIPCGGKTITHSQVDEEMRTAGAALNAYLFDERTFNERFVRSSWRPVSLAEFFRVAKETDIAVFFMEGGLDGPCVMYRSLETKARPSVCFRRSSDGWVYAGGPTEAPYTLYPCE